MGGGGAAAAAAHGRGRGRAAAAAAAARRIPRGWRRRRRGPGISRPAGGAGRPAAAAWRKSATPRIEAGRSAARRIGRGPMAKSAQPIPLPVPNGDNPAPVPVPAASLPPRYRFLPAPRDGVEPGAAPAGAYRHSGQRAPGQPAGAVAVREHSVPQCQGEPPRPRTARPRSQKPTELEVAGSCSQVPRRAGASPRERGGQAAARAPRSSILVRGGQRLAEAATRAAARAPRAAAVRLMQGNASCEYSVALRSPASLVGGHVVQYQKRRTEQVRKVPLDDGAPRPVARRRGRLSYPSHECKDGEPGAGAAPLPRTGALLLWSRRRHLGSMRGALRRSSQSPQGAPEDW